MGEEIVKCPNCGSSNCDFQMVTSNNLKRVGRGILGYYSLGMSELIGKSKFDNAINKGDDSFECKDCGRIFTRKQSIASQKNRQSRIEKIDRLYDQKQYQSVIQECDKLLASKYDEKEQYCALMNRAYAYQALAEQGREKILNEYSDEQWQERAKISKEEVYPLRYKAINDFKALINIFGDNPSYFYSLSYNYFHTGDEYIARRYAIAALDTDDNEFRTEAEDWFKYVNDFVMQNFQEDLSELPEEEREGFSYIKFASETNEDNPFTDRQFIMFAKSDDKMAGYYDPDDNIKWVFSVNNYPNDIKIEGLPEPNILYMANPVKKNTYLPYENAEEILFQSKVREFERLVGCLGATSIRFISLKGKKVSSERDVERSAGLGGGSKIHGSVEGNGNWASNEKSNTSNASEIGRNQKLNPTKYPFIPTDLCWYNFVEEWRDFARMRLENGLTYYKYTFRSSESSSLSTQKKLDISASFKNLAMSINAHYSQNIKETIEVQEETEWKVEVDFKPLEEFVNNQAAMSLIEKVEPQAIPQSSDRLTDSEQFYLDELKDVLEDGEITENDRKRLERRRIRLGISEARALELEQSVSSPLTEDEKDYFDELKEVLDDGIIDDKERRSLDRLKRSLGISDSRAQELEQMARK